MGMYDFHFECTSDNQKLLNKSSLLEMIALQNPVIAHVLYHFSDNFIIFEINDERR